MFFRKTKNNDKFRLPFRGEVQYKAYKIQKIKYKNYHKLRDQNDLELVNLIRDYNIGQPDDKKFMYSIIVETSKNDLIRIITDFGVNPKDNYKKKKLFTKRLEEFVGNIETIVIGKLEKLEESYNAGEIDINSLRIEREKIYTENEEINDLVVINGVLSSEVQLVYSRDLSGLTDEQLMNKNILKKIFKIPNINMIYHDFITHIIETEIEGSATDDRKSKAARILTKLFSNIKEIKRGNNEVSTSINLIYRACMTGQTEKIRNFIYDNLSDSEKDEFAIRKGMASFEILGRETDSKYKKP